MFLFIPRNDGYASLLLEYKWQQLGRQAPLPAVFRSDKLQMGILTLAMKCSLRTRGVIDESIVMPCRKTQKGKASYN
jgi:hypothetical protein